MADSYKNIRYNKESPKEAAVYYYLIGDKTLQELGFNASSVVLYFEFEPFVHPTLEAILAD